MTNWLIVINTLEREVSEDTMNNNAGNLAGRIGKDTYVEQVRRLEPNERVKVVEFE